MGRKKSAQVNPLPGKRLKMILTETGTTHGRLGELINLSEQQISKIINGHVQLAEQHARNIINAFPQYILSWLLGYTDYPTEEIRMESIKQEEEEFKEDMQDEFAEQGMIRLAQAQGWKVYRDLSFSHEEHKGFKLNIWEFEALRDEFSRYAAMKLEQLADIHALYEINVKPREMEE